MNRSEAVNVVRKVFETCPSVDGSYIALMPYKTDDLPSQGYQIHIKTTLSPTDRQCVQELLAKEGLAFKETKEKTIIYKPLKTS